MKSHPLATVAIAAMAAVTVSASTAQQRAFVKAMSKSQGSRRLAKDQTPSPKTFAEEMSGTSKRARELRKKVMEKAKPVPVATRRLQNQAAATSGGTTDGTDDFYHGAGEWDNAFQFDATQYSLSYHRCAAVKQFDDELAAQEDSLTVFTTKNFAVFRFCPSLTCEGIVEEEVAEEEGAEAEEVVEGEVSEDAEYQDDMFERLAVGGANGIGCQSNYGEYMVELEDYLALMVRGCGTFIQLYVYTYYRAKPLTSMCLLPISLLLCARRSIMPNASKSTVKPANRACMTSTWPG